MLSSTEEFLGPLRLLSCVSRLPKLLHRLKNKLSACVSKLADNFVKQNITYRTG